MGEGTRIIGEPEYSDILLHMDYDANTILAANDDDTPLPLTVTENSFVGRGMGGNIDSIDASGQGLVNLLRNGNFESWNAGTSSAPDGWVYYQSGVGGRVDREPTETRIGDYSAKITKSSGSFSRLRQTYSDISRLSNKYVVFSAWVKSANTTPGTIYIYIDGDCTYADAPYSNSGEWELLRVLTTVNASPTSINLNMRLLDTSTSVAYFDGSMLVEGTVCPAFAPAHLIDDGVMLNTFTPASASAPGVAGTICGDSAYIYRCVAADTWERVAISTW